MKRLDAVWVCVVMLLAVAVACQGAAQMAWKPNGRFGKRVMTSPREGDTLYPDLLSSISWPLRIKYACSLL